MTHIEIKLRMEEILNETDENKKKEMIESLKSSPEFKSVQNFMEGITRMIVTIWANIKKVVNQVYKIVKVYRKASRKAFYKKKRTQRKNWKKWKKR